MLITLLVIIYIYYFVDIKGFILKFWRSFFPLNREIKNFSDFKVLKKFNDGIIKRTLNGFIIESNPFKKVFPNGQTNNKFVIYKNIPLTSNDNEIHFEFSCRSKIMGVDNNDFRLAYSGVGLFNNDLFIQVAFTNDSAYILHGIQSSSLERDKFISMKKIQKCDSYKIILNRMGKCIVQGNNEILNEISNITILQDDYPIFMNSQDGKTFRSKPLFIDDINISIGTHTLFIAKNENDNACLYCDGININYDLEFNQINSRIKSNDPSIINFGQGCSIEIINITTLLTA